MISDHSSRKSCKTHRVTGCAAERVGVVERAVLEVFPQSASEYHDRNQEQCSISAPIDRGSYRRLKNRGGGPIGGAPVEG